MHALLCAALRLRALLSNRHACMSRPSRSRRSSPCSSEPGSPAADADEARGAHDMHYERHPAYPSLPTSVPLTYTLTMTACLSERPKDRPTFSHLLVILEDLVQEVARGSYINSDGTPQVCCACCAVIVWETHAGPLWPSHVDASGPAP